MDVQVWPLRRLQGRTLEARLRFTAFWLGTALALAMLAGMSGFLLLQDYQKVRVFRTFEHWVTEAVPSASAAYHGSTSTH